MPKLRPTPRQRAVWNDLNDTVRQHGAWITSAIYHEPLRLECRQGSDLPETLERTGYRLQPLGTAERFLPSTEIVREYGRTTKVARDQLVPTAVEIYSFQLPTVGST
jgi:hypothetical protein